MKTYQIATIPGDGIGKEVIPAGQRVLEALAARHTGLRFQFENFGWGGELNLEYCFEKLFGFGHGQGYPKERVVPEMRNKAILDDVRAATFKPLIECLQSIDQDLLKGAIAGEKFSELFFASCKDEQLAAYIKTLL